jgi:hypothetical protein
MSMSLPHALAILGLSQPFDRLRLRAAHRRLQLHHHPDRGGDLYRSQQINAAADVCEAYLQTGQQPHPREQTPPPPARQASPQTAGRCKVRWADNREKGGPLWANFAVPVGTPLPTGWRRAGDRTGHPGQPWTNQAGNAADLVRALETYLGQNATDLAA